MLIFRSALPIKHGNLRSLRFLQAGLRNFTSCCTLKKDDLPGLPSFAEAVPRPQKKHEINKKDNWIVKFSIEDSDKSKRDIAPISLSKPDKHPIPFLRIYLLLSLNSRNENQSKGYFGKTCKKIQDSLASGFSIKRYVELLSQDMKGPDGSPIKSISHFMVNFPYQSGSRSSTFKIYANPFRDSLALRAFTQWPLKLQGQESDKSYVGTLTTLHHLARFRKDGPDEPSADGLPDSEAASIPQVSPDSVELINGLHRLHEATRESLEDVTERDGLFAKAKAACRVSFQAADADPRCPKLRSAKLVVKEDKNTQLTVIDFIKVDLSRAMYERGFDTDARETASPGTQYAYIALGSNVGNRVENIESACNKMTEYGIKVTKTSLLYETRPMYLEDQDLFLNGVCEVETSLRPLQLLDTLQAIEAEIGREKTVRNGPRSIDLDILLYGSTTFEDDRLSIPHKKMMEREFVLRPLYDLIPHGRQTNGGPTYRVQLMKTADKSAPALPMTPISPLISPLKSREGTRLTNLMTVINMTPDSFSDGGVRYNKDPNDIVSELKRDIDLTRGTPIIDIGGQSTRPNAVEISGEEELSRILPTIKAIRADPFFINVAISVDTYRASVAAAAVEAGADIVNDVSAGQLDPDMLPTIAMLGCTCILMHMRGTPQTMNTFAHYPSGIIREVEQELTARVREAEKAGIRRWRICLDPGIGFAKTKEHNLEILSRFDELKSSRSLGGFPWVVGASRKGFIGKITEVEDADQRDLGTAAAITAAIQGGADIVRIHDTKKMAQVVKMADAIYRKPKSPASETIQKTKNKEALE